jgi:hypothetical protein
VEEVGEVSVTTARPVPLPPVGEGEALAEAAHVILRLCGVLLGNGSTDRGLMSHIVRGEQHIERCQVGMWVTPGGPRPEGDPCAARCQRAHAAIDQAEAWLQRYDAVTVQRHEQAALFTEEAVS